MKFRYWQELLIDDPILCDWEDIPHDVVPRVIDFMADRLLERTAQLDKEEPNADHILYFRLPLEVSYEA